MGIFADTNTVKPTAKVITVDTPQALGDAIAIGRNNATAAAMTNGANWIMAMKIDDDRPMCDLTANVKSYSEKRTNLVGKSALSRFLLQNHG